MAPPVNFDGVHGTLQKMFNDCLMNKKSREKILGFSVPGAGIEPART